MAAGWLHHSALIKSKKLTILDADRFNNRWWKALAASVQAGLEEWDRSTESVKVIGYLGTRICRVVEDLSAQQTDQASEALKAFLNDYVDRPKRGRIFISAGRKRNLVAGLEEKAAFESEALFKLGTRIVEAIKVQNAQIEAFHIQAQDISEEVTDSVEKVDAAIAWLQNQEKISTR